MIDFQNAEYLKLRRVKDDDYSSIIDKILINGEEIISCYKTVRDGVVFTNRRVLAVNHQGITGKKVDITSLPYSKIQVYSIETSGVVDIDSELILWYSHIGQIRFEFLVGSNIAEICHTISDFIL